MNKEAGSLIQYYETGQEEDGYKGYSTNYQDLNVDVYKESRVIKSENILWDIGIEEAKTSVESYQKL
jgi:hypothetical protein